MNPFGTLAPSLSKFSRLRWRFPCFRRQSLIWTVLSVSLLCCAFTAFLPGLFHWYSLLNNIDHVKFLASSDNRKPLQPSFRAGHPEAPFQCQNFESSSDKILSPTGNSRSISSSTALQKFKLKPHSKVLILLQSSQYSQLATDLIVTFEWAKIPYRAELMKHSLPYLTRSDLGKYALVIFENATSYFSMDLWNRQLLHTYCRQFGVGIAAFVSELPSADSLSYSFKNVPDASDYMGIEKLQTSVHGISIAKEPSILRFSRSGLYWEFDDSKLRPRFSDTFNVFTFSNTSAFRVLAYASISDEQRQFYPLVVEDIGIIDGVHRVFYGHPTLQFWLNRLLFLDSLSLLLTSTSDNASLSSSISSIMPLERYLQIDIDDIFVGSAGKRLIVSDVHELLAFQHRMQEKISPNFKLNLGYSGGYYLHGDEEEDAADRLLVSLANNFNWFHHSWLHRRPHMQTYDKIVDDILLNIDFARRYSLPLDRSYSIAPFHSGVFPIHEPMFAAWKDVLGVVATATEHFPHSRPLWKRRGFIHSTGIKVLPRLPIGLFTHTNYFSEFPGGGKEALDAQIQGGLLFNTFLFNPVGVWMTHQSNYALDRLAIYAFESLVNFVQCYTNLVIRYVPPSHLANVYFALYPNHSEPQWTNPCDDRNHLAIWSPNKTCTQLPDLLIVGPQKTGSTALAQFLSLHPKVIMNKPTKHGFEETQFFSDTRIYLKGLDWYLSLFPSSLSVYQIGSNAAEMKAATNIEALDGLPSNFLASGSVNRSEYIVFEKSATYFDNENAIFRIKALLPRVKIIVLIEDPTKRAYSWYQHQRSRGNSLALNISFYNLLTLNSASATNLSAMKSFRSRCLNPGHYAQHIDKWLMLFSASSLHFVDSSTLVGNPPAVLNNVQKFLQLEPKVDYNEMLRLDRDKGFFCQIDLKNSEKVHCLGKSKGRKYEPIDSASKQYLVNYYRPHNLRLFSTLRHLGYDIPVWLQRELAVSKAIELENNQTVRH